MKVKRSGGGKGRRAMKRGPGDLPAKKSGSVRGGRDAASGLPTGKRQHKPLGL
jgi:hypothetical protein